MKLTIKQEKFCNAYVETGSASEAYRVAFSCAKMKAETINRNSIDLLNNNKITTRVKELQGELKKKSDITKERVLIELEAIMDACIDDYVNFDGGNIEFKPFSELTEKQLKAIESIKQGKCGIELRLHGKSWTIDKICKMLGYDAPIKNEHTGKDGQPLISEVKIRVIRTREDL